MEPLTWILGVPITGIGFYLFAKHINKWEFEEYGREGMAEYLTVMALSFFWPLVLVALLPIVAISLYKTIAARVKARTEASADTDAATEGEGR